MAVFTHEAILVLYLWIEIQSKILWIISLECGSLKSFIIALYLLSPTTEKRYLISR